MFCPNCGNNIYKDTKVCPVCGLEQEPQNFQKNINTSNNKKLLKFCTLGLIIISLVVLFSGIIIGVGSGYNNSNNNFDFEPFAVSFIIITGINILFNVIMLIIKIKK